MSDSAKLLAEIEAFLGRTGMSETTFGAKAVNNSKLVARLRAGGSVSLETATRIRGFLQVDAAFKVRRRRAERLPRPCEEVRRARNPGDAA